ALMTFVNEATKRAEHLRRDQAERFVLALAPFAPHVAEELWSRLGHPGSLAREPWPFPDPRWLASNEVELVVQVNGKLRGRVTVPVDAEQAAVERAAESAEGVVAHLAGKQRVKTILVPGRLVNFVVR
ncbi:MAG TPA: class I tRNA ligase family protein, partial [Planctomycetota bacterium]|nr:class I tRNA ligase family protein [Planctomycetota bacterium]